MRKLLIGLVLLAGLLGVAFGALLVTGTIDTTSARMILNVLFGVSGPATDAAKVEGAYQVPEGFSLTLYTGDVPRARLLRFSPAGDLLVSRPHAGDIVLLRRDADGDGHPDGMETVIADLQRPHGMDFAGDWLYIAESNRIGRIRFDSAAGSASGPYEPVVEGLTSNGNHWSKTLRIGPDGQLWLSQGSTCNVCVEEDSRRATLMRFRPDGSEPEIIATGLRNSVGFDWAPWSGELYATDNGRDLLGDDFPPCELNRIERGGFYGWPWYNGDNVPDPDMGPDPQRDAREPIPPVHDFRPHNAPLGIAFVDTAGWPDRYGRTALVALHGSWNRSSPDGYKVVSLHWTADGIEERDFLTGFNRGGEILGRPVDIAQGPDGAIYISDDYAGAIYRVAWGEGGASSLAASGAGSRLDTTPPEWLATADLQAMAQRGKALYRKYDCASCHERGRYAARLDGLAERAGYGAVIDLLRAPPSPMPVFPLSEAERRELAVFLLQEER